MKFKPVEVLVCLPTVLTFDSVDEDAALAAGFNTFLHGKVHLKYEFLGMLGGKFVSLFYMQRNHESQQLRDEFMDAILQDEQERYKQATAVKEQPALTDEDDYWDIDPFPEENADEV